MEMTSIIGVKWIRLMVREHGCVRALNKGLLLTAIT